MNPAQTVVDQAFKDEIEKELDTIIMDAYENGTIDYVDMKIIAGKIANDFDYFTTSEEIVEYIDVLNKKWDIFGLVKTKLLSTNVQHSEKAVIDKLSAYIKDLPTQS